MVLIYLLQIHFFELLALSELLLDHHYVNSNQELSIISAF